MLCDDVLPSQLARGRWIVVDQVNFTGSSRERLRAAGFLAGVTTLLGHLWVGDAEALRRRDASLSEVATIERRFIDDAERERQQGTYEQPSASENAVSINTTGLSPQEVAALLVRALQSRQAV